MRAEPVWDPGQHPGSWRAVWAFSRARSVGDNKTLAVARTIQQRTGLAIRRVVRQLRPLRSATLAINAVQTFPPLIDDNRQTILEALRDGS